MAAIAVPGRPFFTIGEHELAVPVPEHRRRAEQVDAAKLTPAGIRAVARAAHARVHGLAAIEHGGRGERALVRREGRWSPLTLAFVLRRLLAVRRRLLGRVSWLRWNWRLCPRSRSAGLLCRRRGGRVLILCCDLQRRRKRRAEQDHERAHSSSSHPRVLLQRESMTWVSDQGSGISDQRSGSAASEQRCGGSGQRSAVIRRAAPLSDQGPATPLPDSLIPDHADR